MYSMAKMFGYKCHIYNSTCIYMYATHLKCTCTCMNVMYIHVTKKTTIDKLVCTNMRQQLMYISSSCYMYCTCTLLRCRQRTAGGLSISICLIASQNTRPLPCQNQLSSCLHTYLEQ